MATKSSPLNIKIPQELNFLAPTQVDGLVRVGQIHDGGYVIPRLLIDKTDALISLGVNEEWSFDSDFLKRKPHIPIHAYDYTVSREIFFAKIVASIKRLILAVFDLVYRIKVYFKSVYFFRNNVKLYQERITDRAEAPNDVTIDTVIGRVDHNNIFCKIDIESSEYAILKDVLKYRDRIIGLAVEFHDIVTSKNLFIENVQAIQEFYEIAHVHVNNYGDVSDDGTPDTLEISFIRKELVYSEKKRTDSLVHDVDSPNSPVRPDLNIIFKS